ncbi:MAG: hypothetical protein E7337_07175 [Clostridiales bacterium]|nr:hypothetical protein [Clostridiales bacterium]
MTKKQIIRTIAFSLIVVLMMLVLCDFFKLGNDKNFDKFFYTFRQYPEDSIDAVFIGTSGFDRYWMPAKAYETYGMVSYPLSADAMPAWLITNVIEEAQTYHDPKLFVIDVRCFTQGNDATLMDVRARRILDAVPFFSVNRLKIAFKTMKMIHEFDETKPRFDISYILPFIKYHSMWETDGLEVLGNPGNKLQKYGGFYLTKSLCVRSIPQTPVVYDDSFTMALDPISEKALYDLFDYVREHNLEVLFLDTPQFKDEHEIGRANVVYSILEEEGFECVHYYTTASDGSFAIDLDPEVDFYNEGHVNYYGACKFTDAFAEYLDANYDLPDRRDDERVSPYWDGAYDRIVKTIEKYKAAADAKAGNDTVEEDEESDS